MHPLVRGEFENNCKRNEGSRRGEGRNVFVDYLPRRHTCIYIYIYIYGDFGLEFRILAIWVLLLYTYILLYILSMQARGRCWVVGMVCIE